MIRQAAVIIQPAQVRTAHVAHLQFLMARGAGRIGERFQLTFLVLLSDFSGANLVELGYGRAYAAGFTQNTDLKQACVYRSREVGDLLELIPRGGGVSFNVGGYCLCEESFT